jgi:hypothetical protein
MARLRKRVDDTVTCQRKPSLLIKVFASAGARGFSSVLSKKQYTARGRVAGFTCGSTFMASIGSGGDVLQHRPAPCALRDHQGHTVRTQKRHEAKLASGFSTCFKRSVCEM